MKLIKESYWSFQSTVDGRSYNERFQLSGEYSEEEAWKVVFEYDDSVKRNRNFYRLRMETRNVLK